jgi:DNA-binding MarR family transcriptional regulator
MVQSHNHFEANGYSTLHLKVFFAVELFISVSKERTFPDEKGLGELLGLRVGDFSKELEELVEKRYLHKRHSKYGELVYTYKIGSLGGTLMRRIALLKVV